MPRLRSTGRSIWPSFLRRGEVLHITGTNLQQVGVLSNQIQVFRRENFGHYGQAGFLTGLCQEFEALGFKPLEAVGGGSRFEGPSSKHIGTCLSNQVCSADDLLLTLD